MAYGVLRTRAYKRGAKHGAETGGLQKKKARKLGDKGKATHH